MGGAQHVKIVEVCEGVYRLKMPMAAGSVNAYMLRDGQGGWVAIDTGYNSQACREGWQEAMDTLGMGFDKLSRILATHFHWDHLGLGGWFESSSDAPVYLHPKDADAYLAEWDSRLHPEKMLAFMMRYGLRGPRVEEFQAQMAAQGTKDIDLRSGFLPLHDGDRFDVEGGTLYTVLSPGHTPGHCMFYFPEKKLLFSGDMIMPITFAPVSLRYYGEEDPVGSALESLFLVQSGELSSPELTCLPGHGWAFAGPGERAAIEEKYYREKLNHYLERCRKGPVTPYEAAEENSGQDKGRKFRIVMSEAMSCYEYLRLRGLARREEDENGVFYYSA